MSEQKCTDHGMLLPHQQFQPHLQTPNHYYILNQSKSVFA
jgi:hypothetical protein